MKAFHRSARLQEVVCQCREATLVCQSMVLFPKYDICALIIFCPNPMWEYNIREMSWIYVNFSHAIYPGEQTWIFHLVSRGSVPLAQVIVLKTFSTLTKIMKWMGLLTLSYDRTVMLYFAFFIDTIKFTGYQI